jgi:predicted MPP superfamily phosphohydrolase
MKTKLLGCLTLAVISIVAYAYFIEPFSIQVHRINLPDSELHEQWGDIRIAQLSDLHITVIGRREKSVLKELEQIKPDLIVVTGDSAQWNSRPENALIFLEKLRAPLGVYCVMGDADFSSARYHCIFCHPGGDVHKQRKTPIFLRDRTIEISLGENFNHHHLTISGMAAENDWHSDQDYTEVIGVNRNTRKALLILGHFSKKWAQLTTNTYRPLLWLAGDTHGGQIWLPDFIWKIIKLKPDTLHMAGLFQNNRHQYLYVNRGIGTTENFPFRFGVRPEITLISFSEKAQNEK